MTTVTRRLVLAEADEETATFEPLLDSGDALILTRKKWDSLGQPTSARVVLEFTHATATGQNSDRIGATT